MVAYKEPVRLRRRANKSGRVSLYLDIYVDGRRSYEFLKLYLVPERTRADRERNREVMRLAEDVRAKRLVEVREGRYGFRSRKGERVGLVAYMEGLCEGMDPGSRGTGESWRSCLYFVRAYVGRCDVKLSAVTRGWVEGFVRWLGEQRGRRGRGMSDSTRWLYMTKLRAALHRAMRDELIDRDPTAGVEGFRRVEAERAYLTVEELRRLAGTPTGYAATRRAFLFSCLTGLRYSDVVGLKWGDVGRQGEFVRIVFRQQKTGGRLYQDISPEAAELMGARGGAEERVFGDMPSRSTVIKQLERWVRSAGIGKHVTFHSGRHTFAVMMLEVGADLYTVSKLLGHADLATTQIYAKVLDKTRQAAVRRIPRLWDGEDVE